MNKAELLGMRTLSKQIRLPWASAPPASMGAFVLLFVLTLSLPPKWATLHLAGVLLVLAVGLIRAGDLRNTAVRTYIWCTSAWLIPVLGTAALQHALGVATAPEWSELPVLVLRMLGIGLGIVLLVERGWLSLRSAAWAVMLALALHAGAGLLEWLTDPKASVQGWRLSRLDGLVGNPNPYGTFMAIMAVLAVGLLRGQPRRLHLWLILIVGLFGLWASGSRGAALVLASGLVVLFPLRGRRGLAAYAAVAALVAAAYLLSGIQVLSPQSDSLRLDAFLFAVEMIRQAPWLGWGIDSYAALPGRIGVAAPHNMLLDLAVSSGIVALGAWLVSTAFLAYRLLRCPSPNAQLALAILAASIVAGLLEYSLLVSTHFRGIWVVVTSLACCTLTACTAPPESPTTPRTHPAP